LPEQLDDSDGERMALYLQFYNAEIERENRWRKEQEAKQRR
jgi:hypothetical protein